MKKTLLLLVACGLWIGGWYYFGTKEEVKAPVSHNITIITGTTIGNPRTGAISTGSETTGEIKTGAITPLIVTGQDTSLVEQDMYYPVQDVEGCKPGLIVRFTFKQDFVDTYRYEDAKNYCFAMKILYDGKDLGYYNVYRNENGGVSNDRKRELSGCIPAVDVNRGSYHQLVFGSEVRVAKKKGQYGYTTTVLPGDFDQYWFEFSPVKETNDVIEREKEYVSCIQTI